MEVSSELSVLSTLLRIELSPPLELGTKSCGIGSILGTNLIDFCPWKESFCFCFVFFFFLILEHLTTKQTINF